MIEQLTLISAFLIGLLGSTHCLGMCGGISSALSMSLANEKRSKKLFYQVNYNIGRIISYGIIGAIAGTIGLSLSYILGPIGILLLRLIASLILIVIGFYLTDWWQGINIIEKFGLRIWTKISPLTKKFIPITSIKKAFLLGIIWGWLPCGLVYSTVALAMTQEGWVWGSILMLSFGLGTIPLMLLVGTASQSVINTIQSLKIKKTMGILLILFGIWTMIFILKPVVTSSPIHMTCH